MKQWKAATICGTLFAALVYATYTFFRIAASGKLRW